MQRINSGHILDIDALYKFCCDTIRKIHFILVTASEIKQWENVLSPRFKNSVTVTKTRDYHCYIPFDEERMIVKRVSSLPNSEIVKVVK